MYLRCFHGDAYAQMGSPRRVFRALGRAFGAGLRRGRKTATADIATSSSHQLPLQLTNSLERGRRELVRTEAEQGFAHGPFRRCHHLKPRRSLPDPDKYRHMIFEKGRPQHPATASSSPP